MYVSASDLIHDMMSHQETTIILNNFVIDSVIELVPNFPSFIIHPLLVYMHERIDFCYHSGILSLTGICYAVTHVCVVT